MSAKEMFEREDYYLDKEDYTNIIYKRGTRPINYRNNQALPKTITIWKELVYGVDFVYGRNGSYLTPELFKAIQQQILELGWEE